jgi:hypothetical protein
MIQKAADQGLLEAVVMMAAFSDVGLGFQPVPVMLGSGIKKQSP